MQQTIVFDTMSVPENMDLEKLLWIAENSGLLLWDSSNGGEEPCIYNSTGEITVLHVERPLNKKLLLL